MKKGWNDLKQRQWSKTKMKGFQTEADIQNRDRDSIHRHRFRFKTEAGIQNIRKGSGSKQRHGFKLEAPI